MNLQERIDTLVALGKHLSSEDEYLKAVMSRSQYNNGWFTIENQTLAAHSIADNFLQREALEAWANYYAVTEPAQRKRVGIVAAGNIPLVGFHDMLSVFLVGHTTVFKPSDKDKYLLPYVFTKAIKDINPDAAKYVEQVERLRDFDAVIATGSNNTARYFEAYFGKYPNIIRKNRNAVAILDGNETKEELVALGQDVFQYFGLGCRNVSKLYVPENYDFVPLLEALHEYKEIVLNSKYKNNFDYHYAVYMLNRMEYKANGCVMLRENEAIASPIANLYYEHYEDVTSLKKHLAERSEEIQMLVGKYEVDGLRQADFGKAQQPHLRDYADGVDTIAFLLTL
ncbi:MAG: acyl-CoA reductase [Bacteroidota bacterium]